MNSTTPPILPAGCGDSSLRGCPCSQASSRPKVAIMGAVNTVHMRIQKQQEAVPEPVVLPRYSIYRIPKNVRDKAERNHYEPQLISIGPYHRNKVHLRSMEERKHLYLQRFLDNSRPGTRQECMKRLRALEEEVRACYFERSELDSEDFIKMLLLDGCFIVQFFLQWYCYNRDPIFDVSWNLPLLLADLLMVENQIPYFVLQMLYKVHSHDPDRPQQASPKPSLTFVITRYFNSKEMKERKSLICQHQYEEADVDHLLHLYHLYYITPPDAHRFQYAETTVQGSPVSSTPAPRTIQCAKELHLHGVSFKCKAEAANILNVTFKNGVLEIPKVQIDEYTCSKYLNLVAFEQCRGGEDKYFTSYVVLLDDLVNTAEDVLILGNSRILVNMLANEEDAAKFFNQLSSCSYINFNEHYLAHVYSGIDAFCQRKWPKYKAMFRRNYHNSPWSIFGFYLGSLFALITVFTTIITILEKFTHVFK